MPSAGKSVGNRLKRMHRLEPVVRERLDFLIHQRFDFVRARVADDDEPAIVADEGHQILVGEQLRKCLEDFGFAWIVEVPFDLAARFGPELAHQRMQDAEHVEIVAGLRDLVEHGLEERLAAVSYGRHRIGDDEDAQGRSRDDNELIGLHQHFEMSAERRVAAKDASDGDEEAYGEIQESLPLAENPPADVRRETYARLSRGEVSPGQAARMIVS